MKILEEPSCKELNIIITRNNHKELQYLLNYITSQRQFEKGSIKIIIIDNYSFDNTYILATQFIKRYPKKVTYIKKNPQYFMSSLTKSLNSNQYVQIFNLSKINYYNTQLIYEKIPLGKTVKKIVAKIFNRTNKNNINSKLIIERIESDRELIYDTLRKEILEPLILLEMQLIHQKNLQTYKQETLRTIKASTKKLQSLLMQYDLNEYIKETLYHTLYELLKNFTYRTRITCTLKNTGKEQSLEKYLMISLVQIFQNTMKHIEKNVSPSKVNIRIRWGTDKLFIKFETDARGNKKDLDDIDMRFIEERVSILNGILKFKEGRQVGFEVIYEIPIVRFDGGINGKK